MGNTWKGISDQELTEAEQRIISFSGIPHEDFEFQNVIIDD